MLKTFLIHAEGDASGEDTTDIEQFVSVANFCLFLINAQDKNDPVVSTRVDSVVSCPLDMQ